MLYRYTSNCSKERHNVVKWTYSNNNLQLLSISIVYNLQMQWWTESTHKVSFTESNASKMHSTISIHTFKNNI